MKFTAVRSEGGLIPFDILEKILSADIFGQAPKDFGITGRSVLDEISVAWKDARAYWTALDRKLNRLKSGESTVSDTRELWVIPLLSSLGYPKITYFAKAEEVAGKTYAISHRATDSNDSLPIHIVGIKDSLEARPPSGRPRLSPHALMQEFLNRTEHVWGLVTNGYTLRILRDSSKISRPVFIEFDLQQILEQEKFNEFALLFRLINYSRMPQREDEVKDSLIEKYYNEAINTGGRVRDKLRDGVEQALIILGNGFINHPSNNWLREGIIKGDIKKLEYYRQLLRLIYRLLFLMVSEERNLVGPNDPEKEPIYNDYYSVNRLRNFSHSYIQGISKPSDLWEGLLITFNLYSDEGFGSKLSIDPLNGDLFGQNAIPYLEKCRIYNKDLLKAIKRISLYEDNRILRKINYLALDVEELGSVYESLLDFHPIFQISDRPNIIFDLVFGSERKTTGSYYTNHDLVQELIKSALEPLIKRITEKKIPSEQKIKELLLLKVCDPAAGSGHFLLAAARKIATEVAILRIDNGEEYPTPNEFKIALRDVIQRCIYGVDINPLSVDLCKLALWLEGHTKGKPLSFLDQRIKCGNSLIGAYSFEFIKNGIPEETFTPVTGDDKTTAQYFKKRNKDERKGQSSLFKPVINDDIKTISASFSHFDEIDINSPDDYHNAEDEFRKLIDSQQWLREWHLANIWTYSFFAPLNNINDETVPTQEDLMDYLMNTHYNDAQLIGKADEASLKYRFFHWFLEFPEVFAKGGFDCILGNPPWDKVQPEEKVFFATSRIDIASASGNSRKELMLNLKEEEPILWESWIEYKRDIECFSRFVKHSKLFELSSRGNLNTSVLFTDLNYRLLNPFGSAGMIIPSSLAINEITKDFLTYLLENNAIVSFFDFENSKGIFPSVHNSFRFCLLTLSKQNKPGIFTDFCFFMKSVEDIKINEKHFHLTPEDIKLYSPNTGTLPIFQNQKDAIITKKLYQRGVIFIFEADETKDWDCKLYAEMYNMTRASSLFIELNETFSEYNFDENSIKINDENLLPVYEARMLNIYDHRFSSIEINPENTFRSAVSDFSSIKEHQNPFHYTKPRYWMKEEDFNNPILKDYHYKWFIGFRMITAATNERTLVVSVFPYLPYVNTITVIFNKHSMELNCALIANLSSYILDYVVRQRVGGVALNFFIIKQIPLISTSVYTEELKYFIKIRVLELTYTSWNIKQFGQSAEYYGSPFIWDEGRRFRIRCELDALYFKLYGLNREEVDYVLETFPIVKRRDEENYGEYRTKRVILEMYDEMIECEKAGILYKTKLDPPPGDPRAAHKE